MLFQFLLIPSIPIPPIPHPAHPEPNLAPAQTATPLLHNGRLHGTASTVTLRGPAAVTGTPISISGGALTLVGAVDVEGAGVMPDRPRPSVPLL